jgi:hypothetical protein
MHLKSLRGLRREAAGVLALAVGTLALVIPPATVSDGVSWQALLAPYSGGALLPNGFFIEGIRRGAGNDVIISVDDPAAGSVGVEVHVVERGRWSGIRESQSFGIAYETPHSPAAEREAVTEAIAEAIRSRDHGLPSPDAIPLSTSGAAALPWWLAMLRGGRGMLLGTNLLLLGLLVVLRSPLLAPICLGVGAADLLTWAIGIPLARPDIGAAWTVPGAALLLLPALRHHRLGSREDRVAAVTVFAAALALRLLLGAWGPLRINGLGPMWVDGAARDPAAIAAYGSGYAEIFAPLARLAPANPDWAIFACNALLSALVPAAALALARLAGVPRRAALAAALLLSVDPVAIRMAATESYFPSIILLCLGAGTAFLIGARDIGLDRRWSAAAALGSGGLLLAQAARVHPVAWAAVATVPFVAVADERGGIEQRLRAFFASAMIAGGALMITSSSALLDVLDNVRSATVMRPPPPQPVWSLAWVLVGMAAYAVVASRRWLAVPAGVSIAAMLTSRYVYGQSWTWQQCYDRLYTTVPVIALCSAIPAILLRSRRAVLVSAVVALCAWLWLGLPIIGGRTTDHLEYRWLREQLAQVPPDCRIIHIATADKRAMALPTYVGLRSRTAIAMDPREPHTVEDGLAPAGCVYYVHTSLCSSADGRPVCDAIERRLLLVPVARASFPARPSNEGLPYDRDPVETVLARVERVDDTPLSAVPGDGHGVQR